MDDCDNTFLEPNGKIKASQMASKKARDLKILRAIDRLKHACECTELNCTNVDCDEMKSMVVHSKICVQKSRKNCRLCRQLLALCLYHAKRNKNCEGKDCQVPYCAKIKHSLMLRKKILRKKLRALYSEDVSMEPPPEEVTESTSTAASTSSKNLSMDQQSSANVTLIEVAPPTDQPNSPTTRPSDHTTNDQTPGNRDADNQLKKLLHAHECISGEIRGAVSAWPCRESDCKVWKSVLKHIISCLDDNCTVLHCATSKPLFSHWETCRKKICTLCTPIRERIIYEVLSFDGSCIFPSAAAASVKGWHRTLSPDARSNVVVELIQTFLPGHGLTMYKLTQVYTRLSDFEHYEFVTADSKREYTNRLADLIQCIAKRVRHNRYNLSLKEKPKVLRQHSKKSKS